MLMFEAEFYETESGEKPAKDFILGLECKMRAKAFSMIHILEENGNNLREPYSSPVGNGIFELRVKLASDISRVFYFFQSGRRIILTNGYIKKTQKMDEREYARAAAYKLDYERRHNP